MSTLLGIAIVAASVGVAGLVYGAHRLGRAVRPTAASAADLSAAAAAVQADSSGTLQEWADEALGGHLVLEKGELEWRPVIRPDPIGITGRPCPTAAELSRATPEQAAEARAAYIRAAAQAELNRANALKPQLSQMSGPGGGLSSGESPASRQAMDNYRRLSAEA